jgi:anti-sigma factor RsiW
MTSLTHDEIQELLGAYALDAVDDAEHEAVELHLRECPRCRAEVAEHREVAALLANGGTDAPDGVWDRIVAALDESPPRMRIEIKGEGGTVVPLQRPTPSAGAARADRGRFGGRVRAAVLAVAAALILLLGGLVVRLNDRVGELEGRESLTEVASAAVADPASRHGMLAIEDGQVQVPATVTADGAGYLFAASMPKLSDELVYQLWGANGTDLISLGTFDGGSEVVPFHLAPGISQLAVTEETSPGVVTPQHEPIGVMTI